MNFFRLLKTIINKLEKGVKLDKVELAILKSVLTKDWTRVTLFAKAVISSFKALPAHLKPEGRRAMIRLELLTSKAIVNTLNDLPSFSSEDIKELEGIFYLLGFDGRQVARNFVANFTLLFGYSLKEHLGDLEKEFVKSESLSPKKRKKKDELAFEDKEENKLTSE